MNNLYDSMGRKITYDTNDSIKSGTYATTYKTRDNLCIKIWNSDGLGTLNCNTFKYIKKLNLPNYYYLRSMLYSSRKDAILRKNPSGYYYPYINSEDIDILTMPVDYTLGNLDGLFKAIYILNSHNIRSLDFQEENVILNRNSITAIDIDLYTKNHGLPKERLIRDNIYDLENLMIDLYTSVSIEYHDELKDVNLFDLLNDLFMIYNYNGIQGVNKKLKKFKYPIDYIRKYKRYY